MRILKKIKGLIKWQYNQGNENNIIPNADEKALDENSGFEVSDQGQKSRRRKGQKRHNTKRRATINIR